MKKELDPLPDGFLEMPKEEMIEFFKKEILENMTFIPEFLSKKEIVERFGSYLTEEQKQQLYNVVRKDNL